MNRPGPTGLPGRRGVWIGPSACVAGAHLAVFGPDPLHPRTRLVSGVVSGRPRQVILAPAIDHRTGSIHPAGGQHLGAKVRRIPGRNADLDAGRTADGSGLGVQVAGSFSENFHGWHPQFHKACTAAQLNYDR